MLTELLKNIVNYKPYYSETSSNISREICMRIGITSSCEAIKICSIKIEELYKNEKDSTLGKLITEK